MRIDIIPIGNSKGIRIPKALLEQCGFEAMVEAEVRDNQLILRSTHSTRNGWDEAYKRMATRGDDALPDALPTRFEENEWQW